MTPLDLPRSTGLTFAGAATLAAFSSLSPSAATAADYDMNCKLLLCLPGGFPSGCADAFDHMVDRLKVTVRPDRSIWRHSRAGGRPPG